MSQVVKSDLVPNRQTRRENIPGGGNRGKGWVDRRRHRVQGRVTAEQVMKTQDVL